LLPSPPPPSEEERVDDELLAELGPDAIRWTCKKKGCKIIINYLFIII
jgi:hypothetical protein